MSFPDKAESLRAKAHLSGASTPVLVGLTALALAVLVAAGGFLAHAASGGFSIQKADDPASEAAPESAESEGADDAASKAVIFVHVGGCVVEPGVRELAQGSRVQDAVEAAGGFSKDAARDALNLARVLSDGEQVTVPSQEETQAAAAAQPSVGGDTHAGGKVNINTATAEELDALAGVGPSTAQKIVADREANGPFPSPEDLKRVSGIGDKKYAALADSICVG